MAELSLCKVVGMGESLDYQGKWIIWTLFGGLIWLNDMRDFNLAWITSAKALCLYDYCYSAKAAALSLSFQIKDGTILSDSVFCAFENGNGSGESIGGKNYLSPKIYGPNKFSAWLAPYRAKVCEVIDYTTTPARKIFLTHSPKEE